MSGGHANRRYQLLLSDIAMAMASSTHDRDYPVAERLADYAPGRLRDDWLAQVQDVGLRLRVVGLANAGMGSLQRSGHEDLCAAATRYGIPIDATLAESIATHFEERRNAIRRYNRSQSALDSERPPPRCTPGNAGASGAPGPDRALAPLSGDRIVYPPELHAGWSPKSKAFFCASARSGRYEYRRSVRFDAHRIAGSVDRRTIETEELQAARSADTAAKCGRPQPCTLGIVLADVCSNDLTTPVESRNELRFVRN